MYSTCNFLLYYISMPLPNSYFMILIARYCDECNGLTEVCLSFNQDFPICRQIENPNDPTGCGGLCLIDSEICHQLDHNAFR